MISFVARKACKDMIVKVIKTYTSVILGQSLFPLLLATVRVMFYV